MEGFLICTGKRTNQPLFIYDTKINIFSVEELCYYIIENIDTLDKRLFDDRLVEFLKRCERADLALRIEALTQSDAALEEFARAVFSYVNYCGSSETEHLCAKIKSYEGQPVEERLKAVGDALLRNKKYSLAGKQYRRLLEMDVNEYMDDVFYGKIWHNLGVTYARMLYFKSAMDCFKKAYDIYPDDSIKTSMLKTLKIMGADEEYLQTGKDMATFGALQEQLELDQNSIYTYLEEEGDVIVCENFYQRGQIGAYNESVRNLIDKWKKEYREQMK